MKIRKWTATACLALAATWASPAGGEERGTVGTVTLTAKQLYGGLEARRVLLSADGLALDSQSQSDPPTPAQIVTDVIDVCGDRLLSDAVQSVTVSAKVLSNAAADDRVAVELRSGSTRFQAPGTWGDWADAAKEQARRYVQLRIRARSRRQNFRIRSAKITWSATLRRPHEANIRIVERDVQRIVRSTIPFGYQRPDHPDLKWLRETFKLDEVIATPTTELAKVNALCTWVASRKNDRTKGWNTLPYYPWAVRKLIRAEAGGTISGHCASYAVVFIGACNAMGWPARHWGVEGLKRRSHEIAEVYINELGRWVYFDPSLATYYVDRKTGRPLDVLQMHDVYLDTHYDRPGDTVPKIEKDLAELKRRRSKIDFDTFPAKPVSADWTYGQRKKWHWTWGQGVMTTAWLQLTPRSNFLDQPRPIFRKFSHYPTGANGFPVWADARTPPRTKRTRSFFTRRRDFYWTLNQASLRMVRTAEHAVAVEFGNSQPFFKWYRIKANNSRQAQRGRRFTWKLKPGENTLEVNCQDTFGRMGLASRVTLRVGPP